MPLLTWYIAGPRVNFDGFIYIHYAAPPYSACSAPLRFPKFGLVPFADLPVIETKQNAEITEGG